jgi:hypothetical protein
MMARLAPYEDAEIAGAMCRAGRRKAVRRSTHSMVITTTMGIIATRKTENAMTIPYMIGRPTRPSTAANVSFAMHRD